MDVNKEINSLYKILVLYEDLENDNNLITIESYLNYIDRLYIKWLGVGNSDIYDTLKGLWTLGKEAGHKRVKSMVFYMIGLVERSNKNGI